MSRRPSDLSKAPAAAFAEQIRAGVAEFVGRSVDAIPTTVAFRDLGLDSLKAVALAGRLARAWGRDVSPVIFWQYPTIELLSEFVVRGLSGQAGVTSGVGPRFDEPVAIVGLACRFPGGAENPATFWRNLCLAVDAIGEVPADRWDAEAYYDANGAPGRSNSRWGGFLRQVDQFDPSFFGISPREAACIDHAAAVGAGAMLGGAGGRGGGPGPAAGEPRRGLPGGGDL